MLKLKVHIRTFIVHCTMYISNLRYLSLNHSDAAPSGNLSAIDEMLKGNSKVVSQSLNTNQFDFFSPAYTPMYR